MLTLLAAAIAAAPNLGWSNSIVRALPASAPRTVIDTARADLDNGRTPETVAITRRAMSSGHPMGGEIVVLQPSKAGLSVAWRQPNLNPWKLQIGDVDGDRLREVIVGVWKKSPKDPVFAKRTFVYSWNGKRLMPRWLGSRLARRFEDFAVADIDSDGLSELVSLEVAPQGRRRVSVYRWLSFGFEWLGSSGEMKGLARLRAMGNRVAVECNGEARWSVVMNEGKVRLVDGGRGR